MVGQGKCSIGSRKNAENKRGGRMEK